MISKGGPPVAWQVQEAKARFSEMLETSQVEGPQIVTKRGVETAVLVAMEEWREIQRRARPGIKEWLLAPEARTESLIPPRVRHRHRSLPDLD
ncbi:MAG: type II toxin-antitoxin system prevent-host-death family antitoxin [bacterium]|nr:type II toxin-antitoxin system prevent-host-death family antitoxin [bacterium]